MPFVTYALWFHMSGVTELQRVQESHAKEGRGSTLQDLLGSIPDSDADRHERWWRWQGSFASHNRQIQEFFQAVDSDDARKWKLGLSPEPPESLTDAFKNVSGLASELESLLDAGPFSAGMAGTFKSAFRPDEAEWLLRAYNEFQDDGYEWEAKSVLHLLNNGAVPFAASALEYRALSTQSSASHAQALRRMGRLIDALSNPVGLSEALSLLLASKRRDDAYLASTLRHLLPEAEFAAWLTDDRNSHALTLVAKAFKAERLMRTGCLAPIAQAGGLYRLEFHGRRVIPRSIGWMYGPSGLALCSEAMADVERRIERGPGYHFDLDRWVKSLMANPVARLITPNLIEWAISAAELQLAARRSRIIALIVRHAMTSSLPADMTELQTLLGTRASWLDAADDQCAMSYTRLANDRFRIGIDSARSTHGDFIPLDRYRSMAAASPRRTGTPPSPRTDLPPRASYTMADVEIWIPAPR